MGDVGGRRLKPRRLAGVAAGSRASPADCHWLLTATSFKGNRKTEPNSVTFLNRTPMFDEGKAGSHRSQVPLMLASPNMEAKSQL